MKGDVSLGKKFMNVIQVRFGFPSRIFPKHEVSCLYFAMIQEIPQRARQQLRPKPKSSGFGVEADLDFHDKNFFSMLQYQQTRCLCSSLLSRNSLKIISD